MASLLKQHLLNMIKVLIRAPSLLLIHSLHICVPLPNRILQLNHLRVKRLANAFIIVLQRFQYQQARNRDENLSILRLNLLSKLLVLLSRAFYDRWEMNNLVALLGVNQILFAFFPGWLVVHEDFNKVGVVFELGVYYFDVLAVLLEEFSELEKAGFDVFGEATDCFGLGEADPAFDAFGGSQYFKPQIISPNPFIIIRYRVDLRHQCCQLLHQLIYHRGLNQYLPSRLLLTFFLSKLSFDLNSFCDKSSCISLNNHKLKNIESFKGDPSFVKF